MSETPSFNLVVRALIREQLEADPNVSYEQFAKERMGGISRPRFNSYFTKGTPPKIDTNHLTVFARAFFPSTKAMLERMLEHAIRLEREPGYAEHVESQLKRREEKPKLGRAKLQEERSSGEVGDRALKAVEEGRRGGQPKLPSPTEKDQKRKGGSK